MKVKFENDRSYTAIYVDGVRVGYIDKGDPGQVWVELFREPASPADPFPKSHFAARVRGGMRAPGQKSSSRTIAKRLFKYILERKTPAEYLDALAAADHSPRSAWEALLPGTDWGLVETAGKITEAAWKAKVKADWAAWDAKRAA